MKSQLIRKLHDLGNQIEPSAVIDSRTISLNKVRRRAIEGETFNTYEVDEETLKFLLEEAKMI